MQRKTRFHRIQLLAYDLVSAPLWSLPLIGPSPTPVPSGEDLLYIIHPPTLIGPGMDLMQSSGRQNLPGRFPRKIQLLPGS